jgi:hypothetical protein
MIGRCFDGWLASRSVDVIIESLLTGFRRRLLPLEVVVVLYCCLTRRFVVVVCVLNASCFVVFYQQNQQVLHAVSLLPPSLLVSAR